MDYSGCRPHIIRLLKKGASITLKGLRSLRGLLTRDEFEILGNRMEDRYDKLQDAEEKRRLAREKKRLDEELKFEAQFDGNGFHKETKISRFTGLLTDLNGFRSDSTHCVTGTLKNQFGFTIDGLHYLTGEKKDPNGFIMDGTIWIDGDEDTTGWWSTTNEYGFTCFRTHRVTGTYEDPNGFKINRIHTVTGTYRNPWGFYIDGIHWETLTRLDADGFRINNLNDNGFGRDGIHHKSRTLYHPRTRLDINGFNSDGIHHRTGTPFDRSGRNQKRERYCQFGFNAKSYVLDQNDGNIILTSLKRTSIRSHLLAFREDENRKNGRFRGT